MAFFVSLTETRLRRILLVFFILASLFPVILTLYTVFQFLLPSLTPRQIDALRDPFNNTLLAILLIQLMSFVLFWRWLVSWETLKHKIHILSSDILKKRKIEELGENELRALHDLFLELHKEFQSVVGRLNEYFKRSITDELTNLFNRSYFKFKMVEESKRAEQLRQQLSLILFSVDDFNRYSDSVGDKLLQDLGRLMHKLVRRADLPFRTGRNCFALLLPGCNGPIAEKLARKLSVGISRHTFSDAAWEPLGKVTVSCGVSTFRGDPDAFLRAAEVALGRAQEVGRGTVAGPAGALIPSE